MLSIIIPVYNCKDCLAGCVRGLLPLEELGCEIILIDDGSTDDSGKLCDTLAADFACVRCVHQENSGVSAARNRGIDEARGDLLLFVDADDCLELEPLKPLILQTRQHPELDLLAFGLYFDYYRRGRLYRSDRLALPQTLVLQGDALAERVTQLFEANYLSPVWNKLLRRRVLDRAGLRFDPSMFLLEDLDFSLRYLAQCDVACFSEAAVYRYRQPEDEGNAGRRLRRINQISQLLGPLEQAFSALALRLKQPADAYDGLLLDIFLNLARMKIAVSDRNTICSVCEDFSGWAASRDLPEELLREEFPARLLGRRVTRLHLSAIYRGYRHRLAKSVKYVLSRVRR